MLVLLTLLTMCVHNKQTLELSDEIRLCDCPGLVFPSFVSSRAEMVLNGILPIDQLRDHRRTWQTVCCGGM